jgi:TolB-like protein
MQKNRRYRYSSASAIKSDLQQLQKRIETGIAPTSRPLQFSMDTFKGSNRRLTILFTLVSVILLTVIGSGAIWWMRNRQQPPPPLNSVAVLPLSNVNHDARLDNLRVALADAMSRSLTDIPALAVRPSMETQKYAGKEIDPRTAGRELRAAVVVTGHFLGQGERLMITLEAVDVATNTVIWQSTVQSITDNLALTQAQVVAQMRHGLLPALGISPSKKK